MKHEGMTIRPTSKNTLDCYIDADFASLYGKEDPQDPACVHSRTGYIITLGDNPVVWSSKLQSEIAYCTQESEYISLSTVMKSLVYLPQIYEEICLALNLPFDPKFNISMVFEDNQSCLILATTNPPQMMPHSKSIGVKYHWFRSHLSKDTIVMQYCPSELQRANILTKPLLQMQFEAEQMAIMGF
jgi:hypothetical protein